MRGQEPRELICDASPGENYQSFIIYMGVRDREPGFVVADGCLTFSKATF